MKKSITAILFAAAVLPLAGCGADKPTGGGDTQPVTPPGGSYSGMASGPAASSVGPPKAGSGGGGATGAPAGNSGR